jgi:hypothetical protein
MVNSTFICKENDTFYFDSEDYQDELGMKITSGELIKFSYEDHLYIAKTQSVLGLKDLFILKNVKPLI